MINKDEIITVAGETGLTPNYWKQLYKGVQK